MTKTIGSKIKGLSALAVAVVMFSGCAATTAVTETADATQEATQTISGDSGSVEAAAAEATTVGETTVGATVAAADAESAKPKVICKYERVTGSHRKTKVCRTAEQIAERRAQDQRAIGGALANPGAGPAQN